MNRIRIQNILDTVNNDRYLHDAIRTELRLWKTSANYNRVMKKVKEDQLINFKAEFRARRENAIKFILQKARALDHSTIDMSHDRPANCAFTNILSDPAMPNIWMETPYPIHYSFVCYCWDFPWHHCAQHVHYTCVLYNSDGGHGACKTCFERKDYLSSFFFFECHPASVYPDFLRVLGEPQSTKQ